MCQVHGGSLVTFILESVHFDGFSQIRAPRYTAQRALRIPRMPHHPLPVTAPHTPEDPHCMTVMT